MSDQPTLTTATIVATFPDGRRVLLLQVDVDCPECGSFKVVFAGHHLGAIAHAIETARTDHPDLIPAARVASTETFGGTFGGDPTQN